MTKKFTEVDNKYNLYTHIKRWSGEEIGCQAIAPQRENIIPALTPMTAYPLPTVDFLTTGDLIKLLRLLHPHEQEYQKFASGMALTESDRPPVLDNVVGIVKCHSKYQPF
ncbi:hypothetical protein A6770_38740 [Nostoc minutum NIES-26]|uniref:Uncharacterized protein n=1 Tax=Nostoc minutum NIES-26 TaxID=1844469 RepID=A0A367RV49_9NOSO|nr:hypothetical protein A6770_38740 [Nostoc minutum NIES-26]